MNLGLDRMKKFDRLLDFPSHSFPSIHVAGTNGKGSVTTKIACALQAAGKKVGLYTSPHIVSYRERIQINGEMIPETFVSEVLEKIDRLYGPEEEKDPLSYFELLTLIAFSYFAEQKVDIAVLEVGLGGRLDSTNIVTPLLSIITSISFDHTTELGDTLEKIAGEKGGIIKPSIPLLVGPEAKPFDLFKRMAKEKRSPFFYIEERFSNYEEENCAIVRRALSLLPFDLPEEAIISGLNSHAPCRFEVFREKNPIVILDVGHNPAGLEKVFERIVDTFGERKVRVVAGFSQNKDIATCLEILQKHSSAIHLTQADHPRALPCNLFPPIGECDPLFSRAFEKAFQKAADQDEILLVCGTFFMMKEAKEIVSKLNLEHALC